MKQLIADLQQLAKDAGHARPLTICIYQENGACRGGSRYRSDVPSRARRPCVGVQPRQRLIRHAVLRPFRPAPCRI